MKKIDLGTTEFSAEEVRALYFDKNALVEPNYKLYRLDSKTGQRYYYKFDKEGKPKFYMSVTTFIHRAIPTSIHLVKWMADMGLAKAEEYKIERGAYGTFLHGACEELTINKKYDLDKLDEKLKEYLEEKEMPQSYCMKWYNEMKKDILGYAQFMIDYNVEPIAIEIMLASEKLGVAGALDLVAWIDIERKGFHGELYKSGDNKGKPKETKKTFRIKAIIDVKSGKKGFYEAHELQLHTYKEMFEENYPEHKIEGVYNWSGKDWRARPDYNFKDQTGSLTKDKIPHFIQIAEIDSRKDERELLIVEGNIDIANGLESNYRTITKDELVMNRKNKKEGKK